MKICHLTSAHDSLDDRIFEKECCSLTNQGYETYLVANGNSFEKAGVQIIGIGSPPSSRLKRMLFTSSKIYTAGLKIDADLYHLHDPELLLYGLKLKKQGKIVIFDSHEKYIDQIAAKPYLSKPIALIASKIYGWIERYVVSKIDAVIVTASDDSENFRKCSKNIVVVDNYPILNELYNQWDENHIKYKDSVCYIGGLTYARGITHLIKAVYSAGKILYLAGKFSSDEYKTELENMQEYACVRYLGVLNRKQVIDLLNSVEIGCCTLLNIGQYNKSNNFGIKVTEYMSMGLPVIISDSEYFKEVSLQYQFGIGVNPEDVEEIAQTINFLFDNKDTMVKLGNEGRKAVKEKFNWDIEFKKLLYLYGSLIKKKYEDICDDK